LRGFETQDQGNWVDYIPLAEYADNFSIHGLTKQMAVELYLGSEPPLLLDIIADLQQQQANELSKMMEGCRFVEGLPRIS
jgi:hypothetical protein